jgi:hypothetical protein
MKCRLSFVSIASFSDNVVLSDLAAEIMGFAIRSVAGNFEVPSYGSSFRELVISCLLPSCYMSV